MTFLVFGEVFVHNNILLLKCSISLVCLALSCTHLNQVLSFLQTPEQTMVYHRFYLSLMLHYLLKSSSPSAIWNVANLFQCSRGFLQSVVNSTASFASCLTYFTQVSPEHDVVNGSNCDVTRFLLGCRCCVICSYGPIREGIIEL